MALRRVCCVCGIVYGIVDCAETGDSHGYCRECFQVEWDQLEGKMADLYSVMGQMHRALIHKKGWTEDAAQAAMDSIIYGNDTYSARWAALVQLAREEGLGHVLPPVKAAEQTGHLAVARLA